MLKLLTIQVFLILKCALLGKMAASLFAQWMQREENCFPCFRNKLICGQIRHKWCFKLREVFWLFPILFSRTQTFGSQLHNCMVENAKENHDVWKFGKTLIFASLTFQSSTLNVQLWNVNVNVTTSGRRTTTFLILGNPRSLVSTNITKKERKNDLVVGILPT